MSRLTQPDAKSFMSKTELAEKYGISTRTLCRKLSKLGVELTSDRLLSPLAIKQIVALLGHWDTDYREDEDSRIVE